MRNVRLMDFILIFSTVCFMGCGGEKIVRKDATVLSSRSLYGDLVKDGDSYTFKKIVAGEKTDPQPEGAYVRLNDLIPNFNTGTYNCDKNYTKGVPCTNEKFFRKPDVKPVDTIAVWVLSLGTAGVAGHVRMDSVFDRKAYDQAVNQALARTGLDTKRERLFHAYDNLYSLSGNCIGELNGDYGRSREKYLPTAQLRTSVVDLSGGLYKRGDIQPKEYIRLVPNQLPAPSSEYVGFIEKLFPLDPEQYEARFAEAGAKISSAHESNKETYRGKIKEATADYNVVCGPSFIAPYRVRYACPEKVENTPAGFEKAEGTIFVLTKDFSKVVPSFFVLPKKALSGGNNADIVLEYKYPVLKFRNLSEKYIRITSLTIYYNDKVQSLFSQSEASSLFQIAPNSYVEKEYDIFAYKEIEASGRYEGITADIAVKTKVNFGFALSYRIIDQNIEKTLYEPENYGYVLADLIR